MHAVTPEEQVEMNKIERESNPSDVTLEFIFKDAVVQDSLVKRRYKIYPEFFNELLDFLHTKRTWYQSIDDIIELKPTKLILSVGEQLEKFLKSKFGITTYVFLDFEKTNGFVIQMGENSKVFEKLLPEMTASVSDWLTTNYPALTKFEISNK